jgi:DNA repair exonuclease SbcCD ATPase subunit
MKIESIKLVQFRNHQSTFLELDRLNVITGNNAAGKSSVVYALEVALTGRCAATDRGGRGLDDLISLGQKTGIVEAEIAGLGDISRTISQKGAVLNVTGWEGGSKAQQEHLYEYLGAGADLISNLMNVSSFVALPAKEQQAMLFSLAGAAVTFEEVVQFLGADLSEAFCRFVGTSGDLDEVVDLDDAYQKLFAARAIAKKQAATSAGALEALSGMDDLPADLPKPEELADIKSELAEKEAHRGALAKRIIDGKHGAQRIQEIVDRRRNLERRLDDLVEASPAEDIADMEAELQGFRGQEKNATAKAAELSGKIRGLDSAVKAIGKATAKCPTAPDHVKCPLSKDDRKDLADKLEIEKAKLVAEHGKTLDEVTAATRNASEIDAKIRKIGISNAVGEERARVQAELDELTTEAKELVTIDTSALEAEEAVLSERIGRGHALIKQVEMSAGRAGKITEARERAAADDGLVAALEALVGRFGQGPDGIKAQLLDKVITDLSLRISDNLQGLTGGAYRVAITTDPEFEILVDNGHTCVNPKHLSTSERFRVGIAFAVELARLSGLGLLVVDDGEVLDFDNRVMLSAYLGGLDDFETIILLATKDERPENIDYEEGMTYWWIEAGEAERLDLVGAEL